MNDLEYLNQISVKPAAAPTSFFDKKTKLLIMIVGGVLLLAIILMVALSGSTSSEPTEVSELYRVNYRASEIEKIIQTYNSKIKSSNLRSTGATLSVLLAELNLYVSLHVHKGGNLVKAVILIGSVGVGFLCSLIVSFKLLFKELKSFFIVVKKLIGGYRGGIV